MPVNTGTSWTLFPSCQAEGPLSLPACSHDVLHFVQWLIVLYAITTTNPQKNKSEQFRPKYLNIKWFNPSPACLTWFMHPQSNYLWINCFSPNQFSSSKLRITPWDPIQPSIGSSLKLGNPFKSQTEFKSLLILGSSTWHKSCRYRLSTSAMLITTLAKQDR